ncbi:uncharacterized protein [Diabrotica undecimpunctata]|uniref:uncharacterized protein n=1 Tax=Diabrotica undecimpunctata TaxID=50387 RepID=UPI003B640502
MILLFKQDEINLKHIFDEHVSPDMSFDQLKKMCSECWRDSLHGSYKWLDALPIITEEYNNTKHSKTGYKPSHINKSNEKTILNKSYTHLKIAGPRKFKAGDILRVSKAKHFFEKAYTPNWTTELFIIAQVKIKNPITYLLEDMQGAPISGGFYEEELQKTSNPDIYLVEKVLRQKDNKMYVKWLRMDSKHNSSG